jgi:hypothetical protein
MNPTLTRCLDDLERRIDLAQEEAVRGAWIEFLEGRCREHVFFPPKRKPAPPTCDWPKVLVNQSLGDFDAMLLQQFGGVSREMVDGFAGRLAVRCNYGTGILPCLFGCELFLMDEELDTLPTAKPLASREKVQRLVDAGVPDLRTGLGGKVFDCAERFLDVFAKYPKIRQCVDLYHPDLQGPVDVAEVTWGSDIFYAFYDDTDLLRAFLDLITRTYSAFARKWFDLVGSPGEYNSHWGMMHKGGIFLRNDSLMNLSSEMYVEFVRPLDQRLLDEFGGGCVHFCGRGSHYIEAMSQMRGLFGVQFSQAEYNDMDTIFRHTADKGIKLLDCRKSGLPLLKNHAVGQVQVYS